MHEHRLQIIREQWWLIGTGSSGGSLVVGSSGGSLVATPDCETAVLGSNPAISPAYSGLLSWDGLPSGMALRCWLSSEGWQRKIKTIGTSVPPKTIKKKEKIIIMHIYNCCPVLCFRHEIPPYICHLTLHTSYISLPSSPSLCWFEKQKIKKNKLLVKPV
jgi:hypothetical protein